MQSPTAPQILEYTWEGFVFELILTCVEVFLYAIYLILFVFALHTLSRRQFSGKTIFLVASWCMTVLGTAQIVLRLVLTVKEVDLLKGRIVQDTAASAPSATPVFGLFGISSSWQEGHDLIFAINKLSRPKHACRAE
ncbi:hypothetical protein B0H16DRAFT_1560182 [Mycena metata]|uniref:Uncharacterized protein n=1 Tax=Mycena metata TaxID=1033252 RepID=A0AAD7N2Y9_9AGAR|nr:hypothetical protein B0H16DRAFT_1560182 [Mycena metata]